ncbi:esterase/lipase family protein [Janthinobacterium psychrotolerans]|uniref:Triacylglycerol esterase/lipase EstA, alpha/beta hydrolase fold n=1 Tax=Janthinobacterium psychrotolerans TaxID=1747903 RepID=A0A1A7C2C9_9BURK|nr:alpha/beta fold hydrolase [Janthinobacterium psychrotolerans]OBV38875.1 Triacylglycerol esterase/lipase EstA, alpha/beta hydrolase fold [Janthinobacterium psychrotolerans]
MPARHLPGALLLCATVLLGGCAAVTVSDISPADYLQQRRGDVLTTGKLSAAASEVLRIIGSDIDACTSNAGTCRADLARSTLLSDEQRLATLSELWLGTALQEEKQAGHDSASLLAAWLESARYAYAYLFYTARTPGQRAFEERQTQIRDYYNYAVQKAVVNLFRHHREYRPDGNAVLVSGWRIDSELSALRLPQDGTLPEELLPATSLAFSGVRNVYRRDGFGAELVAVMPKPAAAKDTAAPYRETRFPVVTALIRFEGNSLDEVLATQNLMLVLADPTRSTSIGMAGQELPVAANFTAGYGLWLARSGFGLQALRTLFGSADGLSRPQVHLMQPYDPSKRTIVMLHGLASSPEAWINVANELMGDEQLRRRYQIWQVYYPSNAPLAANNAAIRQALAATLAHFDPAGRAPASNQMVLIGHSMGGVLARLMVSDARDTLLDAITEQYQLKGRKAEKVRAGLAPYLNFSAMPQVNRAIFIAAPHRGTSFANYKVARWIGNLVTLPITMLDQLSDAAGSLAQLNTSDAAGDSAPLRIPNSIDNLSDKDPFVQLVADLPISPAVRYYSIMGNDTPELPLAQSNDGVVPYASAHLAGAQSEKVFPSWHSVQENPQAILEIRRILRLAD